MKTQIVQGFYCGPVQANAQTDSSLNRSDCQKQIQPAIGRPSKKRIGPYSFHLNDVIGRGFSSVVYRGIRDNDKSQQVAIKMVGLEGMNAHRRLLLDNQIRILKKISHPYIVSLIDSYQTLNNSYIIMEYCEGGSLQNHIDSKTLVDWPRAAFQIGSACQYLASCKVIHRDIKPANVLIKGESFKLGDFGFAYELATSEEVIEQKYLIGSPLYMSPQSLTNNKYSLKGDAFAFGIFLYYIASYHFPWKGKDKHDLIQQYQRKKASQRYILSLPPKLKHYINHLLQRNLDQRASIHQIDLQIFPRVKRMSNIQEQLIKLVGKYEYQLKICQFIHFLMCNSFHWQQFNPYLRQMMSQHLGQLVQVFGWHKQPHMNELKKRYQLPSGLFQFTTDNYYWLSNCLKDTIFNLFGLPLREKGVILKLIQYLQVIQAIMHGSLQQICFLIHSLTLHQTFQLLRPSHDELSQMVGRIDFYQQ